MSRIHAAIFVIIVFFAAQPAFASSFEGRVVLVVNAEFIQVMNNNVVEQVRLFGLIAPGEGEPHGRQAKEFVADLVAGEVVTVRVKTRDRQGRVLGEMILRDGRSLNRELVAEGHALAYKDSGDSSLAALETNARRERKGMWRLGGAGPSPESRGGADR